MRRRAPWLRASLAGALVVVVGPALGARIVARRVLEAGSSVLRRQAGVGPSRLHLEVGIGPRCTAELLKPLAAADRAVVARRVLDQSLVAELPPELTRSVLGFVPTPPPLAWSVRGGVAVLLRLGATEPARFLRGDHASHHGQKTSVVRLLFFPRGDRLLTLGLDGACLIWHLRTGAVVHALLHSNDTRQRVYDAWVFPRGDRVVTMGSDGTAAVWDMASGLLAMRLHIPGHGGHQVARVPPDGELLVTGVPPSCSSVPVTLVWDLARRRVRHALWQPQGAPRIVEMSPCGSKLVTAGYEHDGLFIWNVATGRLERELPMPVAWSSLVDVSRGGVQIVTTSPGKIFVSDGVTGRLRQQLPMGDSFAPSALFLGVDRILVYTSSEAAVWEVDSGRRLLSLESAGLGRTDELFEQVVVSPSGDIIASCGSRWGPEGGIVDLTMVWEARTGRLLRSMQGSRHTRRSLWPCSVAVGPNSQSLADVAAPE